MKLEMCILASGSTGNAMVIRNQEVSLLVDAGLSAKKLDKFMEERQITSAQLHGILVTHEHADHIRGLGVLSRKYHLPIYANQKTWDAMQQQIGEVADCNVKVIQTGEMLDFGLMQIESYPISHDAAEPIGFCFYSGDVKISLATDLGYVSAKVKEKIADSDVLILESNHDVDMLRIGKYPWNIKRRILGDTGHLSNESAAEALCELITPRTRSVYLAHLSRDHNLMDLAKLTVQHRLDEHAEFDRSHRYALKETFFDRPTKWEILA